MINYNKLNIFAYRLTKKQYYLYLIKQSLFGTYKQVAKLNNL
jgi:hypothetical protein